MRVPDWTASAICGLVVVLAIGTPPAAAQEPDGHQATSWQPCDEAQESSWAVATRHHLLSGHELVAFAIENYEQPVRCEYQETAEFEGQAFGSVRLGFQAGVEFVLETQPPEAAVVMLTDPHGFGDADAARLALRRHADHVGLEIDWSVAETTTDGASRMETFRDPDDGYNGSASLIYRQGLLTALRFSLAL